MPRQRPCSGGGFLGFPLPLLPSYQPLAQSALCSDCRRYWEGSHALKPNAWAHDIWAVGVVWLELILGTPHVFALPA